MSTQQLEIDMSSIAARDIGASSPPAVTLRAPLTRVTLLSLNREICRIFLMERDLHDALSACAGAIVRTLHAARVSIMILGVDDVCLEVAHGEEHSWNAGEEADAPNPAQYERSIPISSRSLHDGVLSVRGVSPPPGGLETFLQEVADELGWCLRAAHQRAELLTRLENQSALMPSTLFGVLCLDEHHQVTAWNLGCQHLLGWLADDVLGKPLHAVIGADACSRLEIYLENCAFGRRNAPLELALRDASGRCVPARVEIIPKLTAAGAPAYQLILQNDAPRQTLQKLIAAASTAANCLDGVAPANDAAELFLRHICIQLNWFRGEIWQYSPTTRAWTPKIQWSDSPINPRAEPNDQTSHRADLLNLVSARRRALRIPQNSSDPWPSANSRHIPAADAAIGLPIVHHDAVLAVALFFGVDMPQLDSTWDEFFRWTAAEMALLLRQQQFMTSLQCAEQNLVQAQKMQAIGLLAGGVAHDFNNLLTIILGFSEIASEQIAPDSPALGSIQEIRNAGLRGAALTRQLLAFSRKQPMQMAVLNLNKQIREAEKMLRRVCESRIKLEILTEEPLHLVKFDPIQFEQVLLNLVVNARDAIADTGRVTISTRNQDLSVSAARSLPCGRPGDFVVISVADSGCGMDEATRARIFEPFFTTKAAGEGTGMGLSTVFGIVEQCGGFLAVDSAPGQGTTISVFIPRTHDRPATLVVDSQVDESFTGTECILLVEDEDVLRMLTAQMLEARGYTVLQAVNGESAMSLVKRHRNQIDLIVTDVVMPQATGAAFAARLRSQGLRIPILLISGYFDVDRFAEGDQSPAPLLRKPYTGSELAAAVRKLLDAPRDSGT